MSTFNCKECNEPRGPIKYRRSDNAPYVVCKECKTENGGDVCTFLDPLPSQQKPYNRPPLQQQPQQPQRSKSFTNFKPVSTNQTAPVQPDQMRLLNNKLSEIQRVVNTMYEMMTSGYQSPDVPEENNTAMQN
jgi:hypothetical protein